MIGMAASAQANEPTMSPTQDSVIAISIRLDRRSVRDARRGEAVSSGGDEALQTAPERNEFVGFALMQREHGFVMGARFFDVGEVRKKKAEIHGVSPGVRLNAVRGKLADVECARRWRGEVRLLAFLRGMSQKQS
jgi:hypothetical protein